MQKTKLLVIALGALFVAPAYSAVPTLTEVLNASGVSLTGYIDAGYTNINSTGLFNGGTTNTRVFDAPGAAAGKNFNSFNLNQAAFTMAKQPKEGAGGVVNVTTGQNASVIASTGATPSQFDVTQAYGSYAMGPLTAIVGKFVTNSGAEVINSTANSNYSRSILFGYAIPYAHTGIRVSYALNDTISLLGGINNGWDQVADNNTAKTVELGITATPIKMLSIAGSIYSGKELVDATAGPTSAQGTRNLVDVVATVTLSDKISIVANYDTASQEIPGGKAKWDGMAVYANYALNDKWRASVRAENFNDKNGYRTGLVQKWKEVTLTAAHLPSKNLELRAELRTDRSNQVVFENSDGSLKKSQNSIGLQALYKF